MRQRLWRIERCVRSAAIATLVRQVSRLLTIACTFPEHTLNYSLNYTADRMRSALLQIAHCRMCVRQRRLLFGLYDARYHLIYMPVFWSSLDAPHRHSNGDSPALVAGSNFNSYDCNSCDCNTICSIRSDAAKFRLFWNCLTSPRSSEKLSRVATFSWRSDDD